MKKNNLFPLFMSLCLSLLLIGCHGNKDLTIGELSTRQVVNDADVSLTIELDSLTAYGGEFVLYNGGSSTCNYGDTYAVEVLLEDGWHIIESEVISSLIPYSLLAGEKHEFNCDWSSRYGQLPTGKYRLVREILPQNFQENKDWYWVSCEFSIP